MAPSMCGATAALWEATFRQRIRDQFISARFFCSSRYVDNRCLLRIWDGDLTTTGNDASLPARLRRHDLLHPDSDPSSNWFNDIYLHPHFYGLPLQLENVPRREILGTLVDTEQRHVELVLPKHSISFRSPCTVSSTRRITQGLTTRIYWFAACPGPRRPLYLKSANYFDFIVNVVSRKLLYRMPPSRSCASSPSDGDRSTGQPAVSVQTIRSSRSSFAATSCSLPQPFCLGFSSSYDGSTDVFTYDTSLIVR